MAKSAFHEVRRLREFEAEHAKLTKLMAEANLDIEALTVAFEVWC